MRVAAKRDATEAAITTTLRAAGCQVQILREGLGLPDLLVRTPDGTLHLVECKAATGALTEAQRVWFARWGGVVILRTPQDALGWLRGQHESTPRDGAAGAGEVRDAAG